MKLQIGIDLGSTAIKTVIARDGEILWRGRTNTAPGQEAHATRLIESGLGELRLTADAVGGVAVTGYGKKLFAGARVRVDEISANAAGLFRLSGGAARTIVNIGGQDLKALRLDENGRVTDFRMNDKCAAGTGRFFELAARLLDIPLDQFAAVSRQARLELELNSTCVVFAESEMVSLLARGTPREEILKALHRSVARRAAGLLGRDVSGPVWLDGGPARNAGLVEALEDELMTEIKVLEEPQHTVAYGALLALQAAGDG
ncbi:MAG: acyl-CoA dehydratase activase [Candidatus Accumulibacter sp.]|jgi:predicted CoA-substrate-specific enzyme activase|nr:acyl-CoA dehydratase activase [Accumulibacter sp.]